MCFYENEVKCASKVSHPEAVLLPDEERDQLFESRLHHLIRDGNIT